METKEALEEKNQQAEHSLKEMQRQASVLQAELEKERILLANAKELEQKFQKKMTLEQRWKQLCSQEKTMEQKREIAVLGRKMQTGIPLCSGVEGSGTKAHESSGFKCKQKPAEGSGGRIFKRREGRRGNSRLARTGRRMETGMDAATRIVPKCMMV